MDLEFFEICQDKEGREKLKLKNLHEMGELKNLSEQQINELQKRLEEVLEETCGKKKENNNERYINTGSREQI